MEKSKLWHEHQSAQHNHVKCGEEEGGMQNDVSYHTFSLSREYEAWSVLVIKACEQANIEIVKGSKSRRQTCLLIYTAVMFVQPYTDMTVCTDDMFEVYHCVIKPM